MDRNERTSQRMATPIGVLQLVAERGELIEIRMTPPGRRAHDAGPDDVLDSVRGQLEAYFAGELRSFSFPFRLEGTAFQRAVWHAAGEIAYGEISTYGTLAARIGRPRAARAVGRALAANPLPIVVPCHRVVAEHGGLWGFRGGIGRKRLLLELEGGSRPRLESLPAPRSC